MVSQVVGRVIGRAHGSDIELFEDALGRQFGSRQLRIGLLPDTRRALFVQQVANPEVALQFEVRPVVKWIAKRVGDGGSPSLEFGEGLGVAGAKAFSYAVGAHGPPFVMVTFQPNLEEVTELPVFSDVAR